MASAQVVETSVANKSPSQDSNHPDDLFQSRYVTPRFKPFYYYFFVVAFFSQILQNQTTLNAKHDGDQVKSMYLVAKKGKSALGFSLSRTPSPIWQSEDCFESNYFRLGQACSYVTCLLYGIRFAPLMSG